MATQDKPVLAAEPQPIRGGTTGSEITNLITEYMGDELPPGRQSPTSTGDGGQPEVKEPVVPTPIATPVPAEKPTESLVAPVIPDDVIPGNKVVVEATIVDDEPVDEPAPASVQRDEKANKAWQKLKQDKKEALKQLKLKEMEIERLTQSQTPDLGEVVELKNRVAEYEAKLSKYDLADTQAFKDRFDIPMGNTLNKGVSILVRSGKSPEAARELMAELVDSGKSLDEINDAIAGEPFAVQGALVNIVTEFEELKKGRDDALANWKETRAALKVQARIDSEIQLMENVERDTEAAVQNVMKAGNWMYARSADNQAWNEQVDERIKAVKGFLRTGKQSEIVTLVMEGVTAADTRKLAMDLQTQNNELKAKLQGLVRTSPRLGGGADAPRQAPSSEVKPREPGSMITELFSGSPRELRFGTA